MCFCNRKLVENFKTSDENLFKALLYIILQARMQIFFLPFVILLFANVLLDLKREGKSLKLWNIASKLGISKCVEDVVKMKVKIVVGLRKQKVNSAFFSKKLCSIWHFLSFYNKPLLFVCNLCNKNNWPLVKEYLHTPVWPGGGSSLHPFIFFFCTAGLPNFNRSQRKYKINITDVVKRLSGKIIVLFIVRQLAQTKPSCCWFTNIVLFIFLDKCFNVTKILAIFKHSRVTCACYIDIKSGHFLMAVELWLQ